MSFDKNICCISDYLSTISELGKSYATQGKANIPYICKFLYRGISDNAYKLIPSIFRKTHDIDVTINNFVDNRRYGTYTTEKQILQSFIADACAYIKNDPSKGLYKWAEYAQHYGVPTRFLDWSENPLVALYFACRDDKLDYKQKDNTGGKDATVWMVHLHNYRNFANQVDNIIYSSDQKNKYSIAETINKIYEDEILIEYPMIYHPYYTDLRMSAQSSIFIVWGKKEEPLDSFFTEENKMHSNLGGNGVRNSYNEQSSEIIFNFFISASNKQSILRELDICGINEKTMFPGLDGTGRYIEMKYRFDLEEAKENIF